MGENTGLVRKFKAGEATAKAAGEKAMEIIATGRKTVYSFIYQGIISTTCPASIICKHQNAILFLDTSSAALLK